MTAYGAAAGVAFFVTVVSMFAVRNPAAASISVILGLITVVIATAKAIAAWSKSRPLRYDVPITAEVPPAFPDNSDFRGAFAKGSLPVYRRGLDLLQGVLKRRFHGRIGYGGPTATHATQMIIGSWPVYALLCVACIGLALAGFAAGLMWQSAIGLLVAVGLSFLIVQWLNAQYNSILKLFPAIPPSTDSDETLGTVEGAGDPFVLKSEIEQRMRAFRMNNLPNKVHAMGWQVPVVTLSDSGRVAGELSVETHPQHVGATPNEEWKAYADRSKMLSSAAALAPLFMLSFLGPLVPIVGFLAFLALISASSKSVAIAETVLQFYRWRSHVVFIELEGSVGRTEIRAGRSTTDSFESRNSVIRSDCQIRVWAATLTTENLDVNQYRFIMGLEKTPESQQMLQTVIAAVRDFETAGVKTRNIDLSHQGIASLAQANVNMEGSKAQARGEGLTLAAGPGAAAPRLQGGFGGVPPAALPAGAPPPVYSPPQPANGFGAPPPTPQQAWSSAPPPPQAARHSMDHIQKAGRTLRLRCPKCSLLNTYAPNDYIQCRNCGLAKTKDA